jgi:hypothetical protein
VDGGRLGCAILSAMPDQRPPGPLPQASRAAAEAIVRRARNLAPEEHRRLGRWTSASLRDPRLARNVDIARRRAQEAIERDADRRRVWETISRPLYAALVDSTQEERRWRIVLLATHFVAIVAIVNLPTGLPAPLVLIATAAAPISAWFAWGRGTAWLGAINAALAAVSADTVSTDEQTDLRRSWANAIEAEPPLPPPTLGLIGALAPSALLVVAFLVVVLTTPRSG